MDMLIVQLDGTFKYDVWCGEMFQNGLQLVERVIFNSERSERTSPTNYHHSPTAYINN